MEYVSCKASIRLEHARCSGPLPNDKKPVQPQFPTFARLGKSKVGDSNQYLPCVPEELTKQWYHDTDFGMAFREMHDKLAELLQLPSGVTSTECNKRPGIFGGVAPAKKARVTVETSPLSELPAETKLLEVGLMFAVSFHRQFRVAFHKLFRRTSFRSRWQRAQPSP